MASFFQSATPKFTCKHGESLDYYAIILDESGSTVNIEL